MLQVPCGQSPKTVIVFSALTTVLITTTTIIIIITIFTPSSPPLTLLPLATFYSIMPSFKDQLQAPV